MKKEAKRITRKSKGAAQTTEASTHPRVTLPPPLHIQKLEGEMTVLVTCEISKAAFDGEIKVNVIEKIDGDYSKRIVIWRDPVNSFYISEWQDWPSFQEAHFFSCRNLRTGVPMDPYFYRKHPLALEKLASNQHIKEVNGCSITDLTNSEIGMPIELAIINNLMCNSVHIVNPNQIEWNDVENDYIGTLVKEKPDTTKEEKAEYVFSQKYRKKMPEMRWYEFHKKPLQQCILIKIAEPLEAPASNNQQSAPGDTVSKDSIQPPKIGKRLKFGDGDSCEIWFESLGEKGKPAIIKVNNPAVKHEKKQFSICNGAPLENIKRLFVSKAISEDKAIEMKNPWRGLTGGPYRYFVEDYIKMTNVGRKWYISQLKP